MLPTVLGTLKQATGSFSGGFLAFALVGGFGGAVALAYASRGWQGVFIGEGGQGRGSRHGSLAEPGTRRRHRDCHGSSQHEHRLANPFDGLRVAIFEARMAGALADLVARHGGVPVAAPALREIPLEDNPDARSFADGLLAGQFDVVIFETGVGVRLLVESLGSRLSGTEWAEALGKTKVVARGPKPAAALRELGAGSTSRSPSRTPGARRSRCSTRDCPSPACGSPSRNTASRSPN